MEQYHDTAILSGALLKDRARQRLSGKYGQAILAFFLIGLISLAGQLIVEFIWGILFVFALMIKEFAGNGITIDEWAFLMQETNYIESYQIWYDGGSYIFTTIFSVLTGVFNAGICLFCLNLACGRQISIADIFYGFRNQFGKTIRLAAVTVLAGELLSLPMAVFSYLIRQNASWDLLLPALAALLAGLAIYIPIDLSISQCFLLLLDFPGYSAGELLKLSAHIMKGHKCRLFCIELSFLPLILLSILSFGIGNLWLVPYMNITYTLFFLNLMQARDAAR